MLGELRAARRGGQDIASHPGSSVWCRGERVLVRGQVKTQTHTHGARTRQLLALSKISTPADVAVGRKSRAGSGDGQTLYRAESICSRSEGNPGRCSWPAQYVMMQSVAAGQSKPGVPRDAAAQGAGAGAGPERRPMLAAAAVIERVPTKPALRSLQPVAWVAWRNR